MTNFLSDCQARHGPPPMLTFRFWMRQLATFAGALEVRDLGMGSASFGDQIVEVWWIGEEEKDKIKEKGEEKFWLSSHPPYTSWMVGVAEG